MWADQPTVLQNDHHHNGVSDNRSNYIPVDILALTPESIAVGTPSLEADTRMSDSDRDEAPIDGERNLQAESYQRMLDNMLDRGLDLPGAQSDNQVRCVVEMTAADGYGLRDIPFGTEIDSLIAIECLMRSGITVTDTTDDWGMTLLHATATEGHKIAAGILLNKGAEIEAKDRNLRTPLHLAARNGHTEVVQLLLSRGANIEAIDVSRETPLHLAVYTGHYEAVRALLEAGADIYTAEADGLMAVHLAAGYNHLDVVMLLMNWGVNVDTMNEFGETPLHFAANMGHWTMVQALLDLGANVNTQNIVWENALHYAVDCDNNKTIQLLLDRGVDPRVECSRGLTAIRLAELRNRPIAVEIISRFIHTANIWGWRTIWMSERD